MLRSILIGLDGTNDGEAAIEVGLRWAKEHDAIALGMSIVDESGILVSEQALFATRHHPISEPLVERARHRSEVLLEQFAERCQALHIRHEGVRRDRTPYVELVKEAQRCDLIVLGQRTHFEYGWRDQADETLSRVLRDTPRSVVVVPRSPVSGGSILVAYDGSLQASRALYAFVASGLAKDAEVFIVSVAPTRAEAASRVGLALEFLRSHDIRAINVPVESHGDVAEEILREARSRDTGLVVMGAYGQPTVREFFLGSVTRSVLERSIVPIFCDH